MRYWLAFFVLAPAYLLVCVIMTAWIWIPIAYLLLWMHR